MHFLVAFDRVRYLNSTGKIEAGLGQTSHSFLKSSLIELDSIKTPNETKNLVT